LRIETTLPVLILRNHEYGRFRRSVISCFFTSRINEKLKEPERTVVMYVVKLPTIITIVAVTMRTNKEGCSPIILITKLLKETNMFCVSPLSRKELITGIYNPKPIPEKTAERMLRISVIPVITL
jgi:hypothetical protein